MRIRFAVFLLASIFAPTSTMAGNCPYESQCNFWTCTGEVNTWTNKYGEVVREGRAVRTCWKVVVADPGNTVCPRREWEQEAWMTTCVPKIKLRGPSTGGPKPVLR